MAIVGDVLNGRFRLDRELGRGGFAVVFLATDLLLSSMHLQRLVAVKILHAALVAQAEERDFLARFKDEASLIATLDHPNILGLYDYGEVGGTAYFVMPYVAGGTLHDQVRGGRPLALAAIDPYLRQAAAALDYAHRRSLVHRDIKPQNMLLREGGEQLLLADFGIAKMLSSAATHSRTGIVGTVAYMAPEQFQGQVGTASDVYALGCVLFQLLTGHVPFAGPTEQVMYGHLAGPIPSVVERGEGRVPPVVQAIIDRSLAKRPQERFASAGELARAFAVAIAAATSARPLITGIEADPRASSPTAELAPPTPLPATEIRGLQPEPITPTAPGDPPEEQGLALRYTEALGAAEREEWEKTIALLRPLVAQSPGYRDAATLLTRAERQQQARFAPLPVDSGRTAAAPLPAVPTNQSAPPRAVAPASPVPQQETSIRRGIRIGSLSLSGAMIALLTVLCLSGAGAVAAILRPGPSPTATLAPVAQATVPAAAPSATVAPPAPTTVAPFAPTVAAPAPTATPSICGASQTSMSQTLPNSKKAPEWSKLPPICGTMMAGGGVRFVSPHRQQSRGGFWQNSLTWNDMDRSSVRPQSREWPHRHLLIR